MKLFQIYASLLLPGICCFADGAPSTGAPSSTNEVEIVWKVPTNHLPSSVWVYRIVPQNFAPAVVSNLMALGSFTMSDRVDIKGQPPMSMYFKSKERTQELGVVPTLGFIYYYNPKAEISGREIATNVPSKDEVFQLGLEYIQKLGIDRSQLATKGDSAELRAARDEGTRSWFDKERGTNFQQIYSRGIFFYSASKRY